MGRMVFVPEGLADCSQARSAWVAMERAEVVVQSQVEKEPGHEQATARRMLMPI
jgi:hypothetical protein